MRVVKEPFPVGVTEGAIVSIGKFDGLHLGHRVLLGRVVARARELDAESVVLTFHRNPREVIRPGSAPPIVPDLDRRLELFAECGIDVTAVITFDARRAAQPAADFADEILVRCLRTREIHVGGDFRFGRMGQAGVAELSELGRTRGFRVFDVPLIGPEGEEKFSSTRIRQLIRDGEVAEASVMLGHPPSVTGVVVHGEARGRELGFPTANLEQGEIGIVPADGVYAGWAAFDGQRHPAAISVSDNPTFEDAGGRRVEAYLLDADLDLYGRRLTVEFAQRLRGIERFETVDALVDAMHDDVARTRSTLRLPPAG